MRTRVWVGEDRGFNFSQAWFGNLGWALRERSREHVFLVLRMGVLTKENGNGLLNMDLLESGSG